MRRPIYLDYAATTPVDVRVAARINECLTAEGAFGNPASLHGFGRAARAQVEQAGVAAAALIGAEPDDLLWTSGATESNNLGILGVARGARERGRHVITSRIEHKAVLDPCRQLQREGFQVSYLEPDRDGLIDPAAVAAALRADTVLVSIMHANNEIGVVQDIAAIGALCAARDIPLHVDAAQSAGKLPLDLRVLPVDLLSFTAHKIYGPKGIGALYVRRRRRAGLQPLQFGGGQQRGLRSGTLPVHQIAGFGAACELAAADMADEAARLTALRERLWRGIADLPAVQRNGHASRRVPGILNVSFTGVEGESLLAGLAELALSSSAACNSDSDEASYVLRALGRDTQTAQSSLRFSLGRFSTEAEVDIAIAAVRREVLRLRALANAADLASGMGRVLSGEAGAVAEGTRVHCQLRVVDGRIAEARFRIYGCPYTLAVCEWLVGRLTGTLLAELAAERPQQWADALAVPAERLTRLLVIEDALRAAAHNQMEQGLGS